VQLSGLAWRCTISVCSARLETRKASFRRASKAPAGEAKSRGQNEENEIEKKRATIMTKGMMKLNERENAGGAKNAEKEATIKVYDHACTTRRARRE
jgi:hypothetical protein